MASPSPALPVLSGLDAMEPERPPPALVCDALEEIFLRVACPADLARAASACVSFRGLISSPFFLRRYHSVHPPLLLGFISWDGLLHPVEATLPSAAVSRGVARTVDLSFLPHAQGPHGWCVKDVRHGRVLVTCCYTRRFRRRRRHLRLYWDVAVCDPLFRRFLLLPPITDKLLASVGLCNIDIHSSWVSLIPSGGTEEEETSVSVICCIFSKTRLVVFIFSTSSAQWGWAAVKSVSRADLGLQVDDFVGFINQWGQCVHGCFYWKLYRSELLKLDMGTMEFSKYDLPPDHGKRSIVIVESGESEVAMFSTLGAGSVEYYTFMQNYAEKSYEWCLKSTIPLPIHGPIEFLHNGQAEGYVFLRNIIKEQGKIFLEYFSLEVKSYNIERACRTSGTNLSYPYLVSQHLCHKEDSMMTWRECLEIERDC